MAGDSLLTTCLLRVVNRLDASCNKSATDKQQIYCNLMTQTSKTNNLQQVYGVFGSVCVRFDLKAKLHYEVCEIGIGPNPQFPPKQNAHLFMFCY